MRTKRHGPDLTGDDNDDEDYGNRPSPRKKQKTNSQRASRPKAKRRDRYGGSDVDDEDEEFSEEEEDEIDEISEEDEEEQPVYASGRRGRKSAAATRTKYEEPATDDELEIEEEEVKPVPKKQAFKREVAASDEEEGEPAPHQAPEEQKRLLVRLKVNTSALAAPQRSTRARTSSKTEQSALEYGLRRSSRTTHEEPTIDNRMERTGSITGSITGRATRASKRLNTTSPLAERLPQLDEREEAAPADILTTDLVMDEDAEGEVDELAPEVGVDRDRNVIPESVPGDEDEDEGPIRSRRTRSSKAPMKTVQLPPQRSTRSTRRTTRGIDDTSDFDPEGEEQRPEDLEMSASDHSPNKDSQMSAASSAGGRRSGRLAKKRASRRASPEEYELDPDELAEEAADLRASGMRSGRRAKRHSIGITYDQPKLRERAEKKDYRIIRPELAAVDDDDGPVITAGGIRTKKGGGYRSLFSTQGPFGGTGGPTPLFGNPAAAGGADSDSSDDEMSRANKSVGGMVGMTPTAAAGQNLFGQTHNSDAAQAGAPNNLGKVKDRKALADADPLGVDQNVNFDGVGGMEGHINSLKEMVLLPLLYPELFSTLHITPPRGVLFHGPPGTGKTLLARALASDVSSHGRKVTFYMRKGADALSKWVGEAERQLRLLFEEARKNQPSIIFFDEIDGLAPVRSSKQEQIHASIVATLLALMDGMDGRGQVIVIGATNRPDSVDPALRRPGRFDREFYFPLPNEKGRRAIIDIHTKGWEPPLATGFKDQLATLTKGYGGADLRALCTEAALNAIQGTYPQIYQSNDKLLVDPKNIKVLAKDFMISVNKMIPSSERSAPSGAAPLESNVEPLLRDALQKITTLLDDVLPERKKLTALEEAEYDDRDDGNGFEKEMMQQRFDKARVFRPRLLVYGAQGMGQSYIGKAILHKFERLHVQSLDLSVLYSDTARSPEAAIVQLFNEARRHKPSVIYIPNVDIWYSTVSESVIKLLTGLLRSLPPNEAVLLLGIMELDPGKDDPTPDPHLVKDLFGFSPESHVKLERPGEAQRVEYFETVCRWMAMRPTDFPDLENRKKRQIAVLEKAPLPEIPKKVLTKQEIKAQKKNDRHTLNLLKMKLQALMDQLKREYRQFVRPPVDPDLFGYLYDEQDPQALGTDLTEEQRQEHAHNRPFEMQNDDKGVPGIVQVATGKFYYNLEFITIERRLVNGYYKRPKDFGADIKRIYKDAKTWGDEGKISKADKMRTNVETDLMYFEKSEPALVAECERVYEREQERQREWQVAAEEKAANGQDVPLIRPNLPPHISTTTEGTLGPISLAKFPGRDPFPMPPSALEKFTKSQLSNGHSSSHPQSQHFSSDPVHHDDIDVDMEGTTDPYHIEPSETQTGTNFEDTQINTQTHHTQDSQMFRMVPGATPGYHHSASTTTSGKKSSDKLSATNGVGASRSDQPDFSVMHSVTQPNSLQDSLPDTQDQYWKSSPDEAGSQRSAHGAVVESPQHNFTRPNTDMLPPAHPVSIASLLNPTNGPMPLAEKAPVFVPVDPHYLSELHRLLGEKTSGFSVEQLEQTNAALVDAVWKNRSKWNRGRVADAVAAAFNKVVKEIEEMQKIAKQSQESEVHGAREQRYSGSTASFGKMM